MNLNKSLYLVAAALMASTPFGAIAGTGFATCNSTPIIEFDGTIVDAALATPDLSTLVDAVVAADLVDTLATTENLPCLHPPTTLLARCLLRSWEQRSQTLAC